MNQCRSGCRAKSISSTPTMLRFGRLRIGNRLGSPQLALPIPLAAEYWNGIGFVTHAQDS